MKGYLTPTVWTRRSSRSTRHHEPSRTLPALYAFSRIRLGLYFTDRPYTDTHQIFVFSDYQPVNGSPRYLLTGHTHPGQKAWGSLTHLSQDR